MFSSMLALFIAASMVSQVFSRPVLLVVFDSVNAGFISTKMKILDRDGPIGKNISRPKLLRTKNPTLPFPTLHTLATGMRANAHGVIANNMFDIDGAELFNTEKQFTHNPKLKPLWTEAVLAGIKTATLMWPGANFLMYETKPIITEEYEYKKNPDWGSRTRKIINWFKNDGIGFGMAYFEDTDSTETVDSYIARVLTAIQEIYYGLENSNVDIIIMSNHGAKTVEKDHVLKIEDFVSETDNCKVIAAGPISFLRFENEDDLIKKYDVLRKRDHKRNNLTTGGNRINIEHRRNNELQGVQKTSEKKSKKKRNNIPQGLSAEKTEENNCTLSLTLSVDQEKVEEKDEETRFTLVHKGMEADFFKWNLNVFNKLVNTLVFFASKGYTFYDQKKYKALEESGVNVVRECGYNNSDPDMHGILLMTGPSFEKNVVADDTIIGMVDVYRLIKRLLGLNKNASLYQDFKEVSENMKKLIKPETFESLGIIPRPPVHNKLKKSKKMILLKDFLQ